MSLTDYEFKSSYNKLEDDVSAEFYMPCMREACRYDRISGYFGSTVYLVAWDALKAFVANGGKMRIICSPFLSDDDQAAIKQGVLAKEEDAIKKSMVEEVNNLITEPRLKNPSRLLACLIAAGVIEIRIAVIRNGSDSKMLKLYHDKAGVFFDHEGNQVGFRGSFNETFKGLSNDGNIESADVFQSWDEGKEKERVDEISETFNRIWNRGYPTVTLYELPEQVKEQIRQAASGYNWEELLEEVTVQIHKEEKWAPERSKHTYRLMNHQTEALNKWEKQGYRAVYQGCTGCGKTMIAISAARYMLEQGKCVLILVPAKLLLYHWRDEIVEKMSDYDRKILLCGDGNNNWRKPGVLYNWTSPDENLHKVVIAMMDTAVKDEFISSIHQGDHLVIIADEVHNMGAPLKQHFFSVDSGPRLGLSATPERYGDPEGTRAIFNYFGELLQPPFTLQDAIKGNVLTPYYYYPQSITLTDDEQEEWDEISKKIAKHYAISSSKNGEPDPFIDMMRIQRARIIKKAKNKKAKALEIIKQYYKPNQKWLVYCEDKDQLKEINLMLLRNGISSYVYYAEMEGDKDSTLEHFKNNGGVLVSIKCLDEGVDIPATTHALVLASSKNPREFIQRRGRILRKAEGKNFSFLYDVIATPASSSSVQDKSLNIVYGELSRAIEFGEGARNSASCTTDLKLIAIEYGIDYKKFTSGGYEDEE